MSGLPSVKAGEKRSPLLHRQEDRLGRDHKPGSCFNPKHEVICFKLQRWQCILRRESRFRRADSRTLLSMTAQYLKVHGSEG